MRRHIALALLASLSLAFAGTHARADVCSSCPAPGEADLAGTPGFSLDTRSDFWGNTATDTLHTDGGECTYEPVGEAQITVGKTWSVARGHGVVFNCPWGSSGGSVSYTIADGDSTDWEASVELNATLSAVLAKMSLTVGAGLGGGTSHGETVTVTQTLQAGADTVLDWTGYFRIADLTLDAELKVRRRFAWWTKNQVTDHEVHAKGNHTMDCGTEQVRLRRKASIDWEIGVVSSRCDGTGVPVDLGTFPKSPPPPTTPPATTPSSDDLPPPPGGPIPPDEPADEPAGESPAPGAAPAPLADPVPPPPAPTPTGPTSSADLPPPPAGTIDGPPTGDPSEERP